MCTHIHTKTPAHANTGQCDYLALYNSVYYPTIGMQRQLPYDDGNVTTETRDYG